jgi:thiamine pyrophosphokinase
MRCIIFAASIITDYTYIREILLPQDYIICADGGLKHANMLNVKADIIIGDLDSNELDLPTDTEIIKFATQKDETDTMLAVILALERGYKDILIFGGLGGRFDHSLANLGILYWINLKGGNGRLIDEKNDISILLHGKIEIHRRNGWKISFFPLNGEVKGVTLTGLKYPLSKYHLKSQYPIAISNEFISDTATIEIEDGVLAIVLARD